MKSLDVEKLLLWGAATDILTKKGPRIIRRALVTDEFWNLWQDQKETLRGQGVTMQKWRDQWWATLWAVPAPPPRFELVEVPAAIAEKCLDFQVSGVAALASAIKSNRFALDASDPGTGKTFISLAAAKILNFQVVVVCPKRVRTCWLNAAKHFGIEFFFVSNYEQFKLGKTRYCHVTRDFPKWRHVRAALVTDGWFTLKKKKGERDFTGEDLREYGFRPGEVVANIKFDDAVERGNRIEAELTAALPGKKKSPVKKVQVGFDWTVDEHCLVIFDEVHKCKGADSQNCEMLIATKRAGIHAVGLSATSASNPLEMRAVAFGLGLYREEKDFYPWLIRNGCRRGRFGMYFDGDEEVIKRLHHQIFGAGKGNRICKDQIPDFPETSVNTVLVDFDTVADIQKVYDEMAVELQNLKAASVKDKKNMALTKALRARQKTELLKMPTEAEMALDAIEEGMSVVIFVNFTDSMQKLAKLLNTDCLIYGGQDEVEQENNRLRFQRGDFPRLAIINPNCSAEDVIQALGRVQRAVDKKEKPDFRKDHSRIIICNLQAGGVGISLHHLGGKKSIQRLIIAANTIEEASALSLESKIKNIHLLNDGDVFNPLKIVPELQPALL